MFALYDAAPSRVEDEYEVRVPTVLPVPPRPKRHVLLPIQPSPFLVPKPLRHASSQDFHCEKVRYYRSKTAGTSADPDTSLLRPLSPADPSQPRRRFTLSTPTPVIQVVPPVPAIPAELVRPTDKRATLPSVAPRSRTVSSINPPAEFSAPDFRRPRRGTLGTRCISMSAPSLITTY